MNPSDQLYDRFIASIREKNLLDGHHRVLLAVSGGMDSMAMAALFHQSPFFCGVAHCNFQLRGDESDKDQQLVKEMAQQLNMPFFVSSFETKVYARQHKLSIQMAARHLRYEWLEKVRSENHFDIIATAHHLDDSIETLFLNLIRGTGVNGLKGIPVKSGSLIRPLLFATRMEIGSFVVDKNIGYREDASNAEDKYQRNKIRHLVVPVLKEMNPAFDKVMRQFFDNIGHTLEQVQSLYEEFLEKCVQHGHDTKIFIKPMLTFPGYQSMLYDLLQTFNFSPTVCTNLAEKIGTQAGKTFLSPTHIALLDRDAIIISPLALPLSNNEYVIDRITSVLNTTQGTYTFDMNPSPDHTLPLRQPNANLAVIDADLLSFPLTVRPWIHGDRMIPMGMSGSKKISDIFIDKKIPRHKKDRVLLLISDSKLVWLTGIAISEEYKVTGHTKNFYCMRFFPNNTESPLL